MMEDLVNKTVISTKKCTQCNKLKPFDMYNKQAEGRLGLASQCKVCVSAYGKRRWKAAGVAAKSAERSFIRGLKRFGLTPESFDILVTEQGNLCKICGNPETNTHHKSGKLMRLSVDHCHASGKVRGLLCNGCNTSIGRLGDTYESVLRAAEYLRDNG